MRIYKSFFRFEKCRKACKYRLYRLMRTYKEIVKNYILIYTKFNDLDRFYLGKLLKVNSNPLLDGSNVYIDGRSLNRVLNMHGHEMSKDEFSFIADTSKSLDYYADNLKRHENSLILLKKLPIKDERDMECIFVKHGNSKVIHFHKMGNRKLRKLEKESNLIDIRRYLFYYIGNIKWFRG